ncbi:hypothetical protein PFISCL1PPCAC_22577 [Pristionchus fissidentatus]|uniref:Tyrosine-protein phosphatase domain-containing protein n=1 Tax=Pristionchus fissidentatus TaxID=1538716 RepID=A0AAV5WI12_9BILA|nr:hypothetical protein PFISCL1PPCAC_22577 [Pristionchus fissidentatus]
MFDDPPAQDGARAQTISEQQEELKNARLKLFAARSALDEQPKLIEQAVDQINRAAQPVSDNSPGAYSLYAHHEKERAKLAKQGRPVIDLAVPEDEEARTQRLMFECRSNLLLNEQLLYDTKYDSKWKTRYTDVLLQEEGRGKKKPENRQGWVVPLRRIAEKAGMDSKFFTHNRFVELPEARAHLLHERLTMCTPASEWITAIHPELCRNPVLERTLSLELDCRAMQTRVALFHHRLLTDRDRVRVHGSYYNNIYLGKRMFGPARKQKFTRTILGGIERRFEILDNQVNHLPFTHYASDRNPDKCRNPRIKCRDDTRVVLRWPTSANDSSTEEDSFIHANRVEGGPLFSRFILTQAPLPSTISDFWRMVWQERVPYIFMLVSRKQSDRCAPYWPRAPTSEPVEVPGGIRMENLGVDEYRDALFRVTYLRLIGPNGEQRHVEHWQADLNNADNVASPLAVLRLARACGLPVVLHDRLGVSRAAAVVAAEAAICSLLRGPTYTQTVQKAVHWVRSQRAFAIETPMQFVYVHRVVCNFFRPLLAPNKSFDADYQRWMEERASRMFLDDKSEQLPGYRMLSPRVDPDLLRMARRGERPDDRREAHDVVGELPLPVGGPDVLAAKKRLPNKYPVGSRYL